MWSNNLQRSQCKHGNQNPRTEGDSLLRNGPMHASPFDESGGSARLEVRVEVKNVVLFSKAISYASSARSIVGIDVLDLINSTHFGNDAFVESLPFFEPAFL